jgi:SAM-dependent methyltransferase
MKVSNLPDREKLDHLLVRERSLLARTIFLAEQYKDLRSFDFHRFIDTEAILHYRELQEVSPPFPDSSEMVTVGGETDLRKFLAYGRSIFDMITALFPQSNSKASVLDFGVGCGRTSRHFFRYMDQYDVFGCDVDSAAIKYLNSEVKFISASVSGNKPPLNYTDNKFDIIFSVSVFSHLDVEVFASWLNELSRCLKPGGTLIITTHGRHALNLLSEPGRASQINVDEALLNRKKSLFSEQGFLWVPQAVGSADIDASQYGISFVSRERIESMLPASLVIQSYLDAYIGEWQDAIVLRRSK